jgi:hypothetical protein
LQKQSSIALDALRRETRQKKKWRNLKEAVGAMRLLFSFSLSRAYFMVLKLGWVKPVGWALG